ncbi:MAG: MurR/RpiR family transcriptional regulator [Lachnotalea sp.]
MAIELTPEYLQNLSQSEYEVLEYIYKNKRQVLNMSIKELSTITFFSTATIMRLCKKLQLSGFSELKYMLRQDLKSTNATATESYNVEEMSEIFCSDLHETCTLINPNSMKQVVEFLMP